MKVIGVYKITNPEGLIYIGSSKDAHKRMRSYGWESNCKKKTRFIGESINKYGMDNHVFEIIEVCELHQLTERERHWQETLNTLHPFGLNKNLVSCAGKKQIASADTIEQIRQSKIGLTPWNLGLEWSAKTRKNISNAYDDLDRAVRGINRLVFDPETGVYFYSYRDAARALNMPKMSMQMNLTAPNKDYKRNKTRFILA